MYDKLKDNNETAGGITFVSVCVFHFFFSLRVVCVCVYVCTHALCVLPCTFSPQAVLRAALTDVSSTLD